MNSSEKDSPPSTDSRSLVARCFALVPCAGSGSRAGTLKPKQYELIAGQSMVMHTLAALRSVERLQQVLVVVSPSDTHVWPDAPEALEGAEGQRGRRPFERIACGGDTRAESVFNGLSYLLKEG